MSLENMNEKQLRDRMRFLSDKIENIWIAIEPKIREFSECKLEFDQILNELISRGLETNEAKPKI